MTDSERRELDARGNTPPQRYRRALGPPDVRARPAPNLRELLALGNPLNDALSATLPVRSGSPEQL